MDQKKAGNFLQSLRKEAGLTQKELADRICVSDKTISKWENGNSMPDTGILSDLCRELNVSVNEFLCCERISPEEYSMKAEVNMMTLIKENQTSKKKNLLSLILGILFLFITLILIFTGMEMRIAWFLDLPSLILPTVACIALVLLSGLKDKHDILHFLRKMILPVGITIALFQFLTILYHAPSQDHLGPNLAVNVIAIIYSFIAYMILFLIEQRSH